MHDINFTHEHKIKDYDFAGCCKDCRASLEIIKPHIMAFERQIKTYTKKMLTALEPDDLYRLFQLLDDLAHMNTGTHFTKLILNEPDIKQSLPIIRSYYSTFFSIHERHLAEELLKSSSPWQTLNSFPLYPRYESLVRSQMEALHSKSVGKTAFIGCGPVPMTLILMSRLYGIKSIGLDSSKKSVALTKMVIQCLGLENEIEIVPGDDSALSQLEWDMVLVAALAEPKARIFQILRKILKERQGDGPVIFRTYTGMRAILHEPVQPGDTKGFIIIKEIPPTGRVNNTTVFAEVAK